MKDPVDIAEIAYDSPRATRGYEETAADDERKEKPYVPFVTKQMIANRAKHETLTNPL